MENTEIEKARKNPDCYDENGGYVGPGADLYGSTQTVDEYGVPLEKETETECSGIAREKGLTADQISFELIAY